MFTVEDSEGNVKATAFELEAAIDSAKLLLEDGADVGSLTSLDIYEHTLHRTATFGPEGVEVLMPGEKIRP